MYLYSYSYNGGFLRAERGRFVDITRFREDENMRRSEPEEAGPWGEEQAEDAA